MISNVLRSKPTMMTLGNRLSDLLIQPYSIISLVQIEPRELLPSGCSLLSDTQMKNSEERIWDSLLDYVFKII